MALIRKTNPVALDKQIDLFQNDMWTALGFSDWESFHRVYGVPHGNGLIPEPFLVDGEYNGDVFHNDNVTITSFFYASDSRTVEDGLTSVEVAWIFSMNLEELYPLITLHRADEEFNNAVQNALIVSGWDEFELIRIDNGVDNVYREFITDQIKFTDMSEMNVVRFDFTVQYTPDCT